MDSPGQNPDPTIINNQLTEIQEFLNRFSVFSGAPAGVVRLFAYLSKREEYTKGQQIMTQGEPSDRFFLILSGKVDIFQNHSERRFHLQLLCADSINYFGELALLAKFDWFFSARAWTDVELLTISRESFSKVMERYPEFYQSMVQKIIKLRISRFADQQQYLMDHVSSDAWREYPSEE